MTELPNLKVKLILGSIGQNKARNGYGGRHHNEAIQSKRCTKDRREHIVRSINSIHAVKVGIMMDMNVICHD
eukprot:CAMPEP_0178860172 /NCGR_PEP_ID=MMETSP0747-20121128/1600_1 /TAXON_ID=913974 /ORGANISM="Nitzschia punctata, Strain CCMP561" /LENGTH=71 /DNA_ID=CAMNT_0020526605 /DNA_START=20 /DNA_END=235 /DNA_ORIENTATION=+